MYRRIIYASRGEIFGQWNCEFTYVWVELKEKPKVSAKGVEVVLKEKEKKFLFASASSRKEIHITDKKLAEVGMNCRFIIQRAITYQLIFPANFTNSLPIIECKQHIAPLAAAIHWLIILTGIHLHLSGVERCGINYRSKPFWYIY